MITELLRTWQTSVAGVLAGTLVYVQQAGFKIPADKGEWGALGIGALLAWLGIKSEQTK